MTEATPAHIAAQDQYGRALFVAMNDDQVSDEAAERFEDLDDAERALYVAGAAAVIEAYDAALFGEAGRKHEQIVGFDTREMQQAYVDSGREHPADALAKARAIEAQEKAQDHEAYAAGD